MMPRPHDPWVILEVVASFELAASARTVSAGDEHRIVRSDLALRAGDESLDVGVAGTAETFGAERDQRITRHLREHHGVARELDDRATPRSLGLQQLERSVSRREPPGSGVSQHHSEGVHTSNVDRSRYVDDVHRWPLVVAVALAACAGSTPTEPATLTDASVSALLDVRASGCQTNVGLGTASLIDDTLALTAAHVVAGADAVSVIDLDGLEHAAEVVWFDPDLDLAALRVPAGIATPLEIQPDDVDDVDRGVVAVSRGEFDDRVVTTSDVDVLRHVNVETTDIYLEREVVRPGFELTGDIEPGDSGTVVVGPDGAAGVVWSRSTRTTGRAWAVDIPAEFRDSTFLDSLDAPVELGPCLG